MSVFIGADLVPTASNTTLFVQGKANALVGEALAARLGAASLRIFNLEVPLTDTAAPIRKCGPNLIAPRDCIAGYRALGADLLTLANNHILDQGVQGLHSTLEVLKNAGIMQVGAGENLGQAMQPVILPVAGKRVGVYACAEHEFSIATENMPGANPFDPLESPDHVAALKTQCDYVIVLYHGGKEHYRYPSPLLQKRCRKLVEKGADLVICQHSHCIGCEEDYRGGKIVYGQGNFLFDLQDNEFWDTSLLVEITDDFSVRYIPLVKQGNGVREADPARAERILKDFHARSEEILQPGFIQRQYQAFADSMLQDYALHLGNKRRPFIYKALNRLLGRRLDQNWTYHYLRKTACCTLDYLECEAHCELLAEGLRNRINNAD